MSTLSRALALAAACAAFDAPAEVYCVANPTQLVNAVTSAQGGGSSVIRIRTGTYVMGAMPNVPAISITDTSNLSISGGWNSSCTAQTASTPDATILDASGSGQLLNIVYANGASHELDFSMLSFRGGVNTSPIRGGCIYAEMLAGAGAILRFDNVSFRGCINAAANGGSAALRTDLDGVLFAMRSSVIADNTIASGNAVFLRALGGGTYSVTNNTIAYNASPSGHGLNLAGESTDFFRLTNNIGHANGGTGAGRLDLFMDSSVRGVLNNNHFGATSVIPAGVTVNAASSGDPGFAGSTLQLRASSSARDSGLSNAPGGITTTDYTRNPRILGNQVDRGAYEYDGLLVNGFE